MSVGSNLFLKATLGVAPSCTMALTLSYLSPVHSYALFNFLINSTFLICEAVVLREFGKIQFIQLGLTFVYSLFIEFTSYGLFFIEPHGLAAKILLSVIACAVLSTGVGFTISSGFAVMPMEGLVKSIAEKKKCKLWCRESLSGSFIYSMFCCRFFCFTSRITICWNRNCDRCFLKRKYYKCIFFTVPQKNQCLLRISGIIFNFNNIQ